MAEMGEAFVGIDVAKLRNAVAVADAGRDGEVRFHGEVDASPESMRRLAAKLAGKYERLHFCYEAGPTGYGLHRLLTDLGHSCVYLVRKAGRCAVCGDARASARRAGMVRWPAWRHRLATRTPDRPTS